MEIIGFENYMIHRDGRVYNQKYDRFLKHYDSGSGYLQVGLWKDSRRKQMKIHRLIGNAYIENPENKPCIDHIDRNPQNNNIENLRWVTTSENNRNRSVYGAIPFRGVSKNKNKFQAMIRLDGKLKHLGTYNTPEKASEVYNTYCINNGITLY